MRKYRGKYKRINDAIAKMHLSELATNYVRQNAFKKGSPNMTARFALGLIPEQHYRIWCTKKISVEVSRRWLHDVGFKVKRITKGIYVDGHEREDVVMDRDEFFKSMTALGFLQISNAPSEETAGLLPDVEVSPDANDTIFWFHDESTYHANDDEFTMWNYADD